jgi:hypothetical protein
MSVTLLSSQFRVDVHHRFLVKNFQENFGKKSRKFQEKFPRKKWKNSCGKIQSNVSDITRWKV